MFDSSTAPSVFQDLQYSAASSPATDSTASTVAGDDFNEHDKDSFSSFLHDADRVNLLREYFWASPQAPAIRPIDTLLSSDGPGSAPWDNEEWDDYLEFEPQFALESPNSLPLPPMWRNIAQVNGTPKVVQSNTPESHPSSPESSTDSSGNRYNPYSRLLNVNKHGANSQNNYFTCQCGQLSSPDYILNHLRSPPHNITWDTNERKAPCPWEGCNCSYTTLYRLTLHIREKHWGVTYPCEWCHGVFNKTGKLHNHLLVCAANPKNKKV
ncbi:hypothetical protein E1B28_013254 [Marasmius oreades]|uniref:C2H2-type domain-containing protein n=1 Tax=Marasmius oreades TaxID=181124 RepID=A0A9P7RQ65_9AGAR|nr:uncharacterized protein E1B28_013254 [Marasmius oreades]KAG7087276.1 hypothetical protein E1B28_013254 [Marasmius oreades]